MKTVEHVRAEFNRRGISLAEWARQHEIPRSAVVYVLRGGRALRGQAHNVAVLLELKDGLVRDGARKRRAA